MWFGHKVQIIFCHFIHVMNFVISYLFIYIVGARVLCATPPIGFNQYF